MLSLNWLNKEIEKISDDDLVDFISAKNEEAGQIIRPVTDNEKKLLFLIAKFNLESTKLANSYNSMSDKEKKKHYKVVGRNIREINTKIECLNTVLKLELHLSTSIEDIVVSNNALYHKKPYVFQRVGAHKNHTGCRVIG